MSLSLTRAFSALGARFDRTYLDLTQLGLAAGIWFSVFFNAAHDEWAACAVFGLLTLLVPFLLLGHFRTRRPLSLPLIYPTLLFLAALVLSTRYSYDFVSSRWESWVWFYCFVAFYLFVNVAQTSSELDLFFVGSSAVLVPLALMCLSEQYAVATTYLRTEFPGEAFGLHLAKVLAKGFLYNHWEICATLLNSNVLSGFVLYWLFLLWDKRKRWVCRPILISAFIILLLAHSGWAGMSILVGGLFYKKEILKKLYLERKREFITYFALFTILCAGIVLFKFGHHQTKYYSATNRLDWWWTALRMAQARPITGVGLGAFSVAYPYFEVARRFGTIYAHSFPLQLLSETGLLGTVSLLGFAIAISRRTSKGMGKRENTYRRVYWATILTVLCYSMININLEYFLNKLVLLLLFGSLVNSEHKDFRVTSGNGFLVTWAILILLIPNWLAPW
jgi:O-antigen ligase